MYWEKLLSKILKNQIVNYITSIIDTGNLPEYFKNDIIQIFKTGNLNIKKLDENAPVLSIKNNNDILIYYFSKNEKFDF